MPESPFPLSGTFPHRLDPRTRLVAALAFAVLVSLLRTPLAAWTALAFGLALLVPAAPAPKPLLKRLLLLNLFIFFIWLTIPATMPGESVLSIGPVSLSREGIRLALLVTLKSNAVLLTLIAMLDGLAPPRIGSALEALGAPSKLVFLFLFTYRYIHAIGEEWARLETAAALRGFSPGNNLHTYRTIGNRLGLVFVNSFDRSTRVYEAMLLRGFAGRFHTLGGHRLGVADMCFGLLLCLIGAVVAGLDIHFA